MNIEGMSDEQKRIRIAEACGWKFPCQSCLWNGYGDRWRRPDDSGCEPLQNLPDYLNDLNAMHAAAMYLRALYPLRYVHYTGAITQIVAKANSDEGAFAISSHDATARQRADAFLSTLPEPEQETK